MSFRKETRRIQILRSEWTASSFGALELVVARDERALRFEIADKRSKIVEHTLAQPTSVSECVQGGARC
jgi:hypothetical protein